MPHQLLVKSGQNYVAIHLCGITRATKVSNYLNDNGTCGRKTNTVEPYIRITYPCDLYPLAPHFHIVKLGFTREFLLAHLSRRLIGELIVYQWSVVRRTSSVGVRRLSTMLKHLLLRNRLADQSQILCGAHLGRGNENLFAASGSHDQDGRHAHIW